MPEINERLAASGPATRSKKLRGVEEEKKRGGEKGEDEASRGTNAAGQGVQGEINNLEKGGEERDESREECEGRKRERAKK